MACYVWLGGCAVIGSDAPFGEYAGCASLGTYSASRESEDVGFSFVYTHFVLHKEKDIYCSDNDRLGCNSDGTYQAQHMLYRIRYDSYKQGSLREIVEVS